MICVRTRINSGDLALDLSFIPMSSMPTPFGANDALIPFRIARSSCFPKRHVTCQFSFREGGWKMKLRHMGNKVAGAIFAFSLLFGIGIASSATANAQYQNDQYRRDRNRDYRDQRRRDRDWRDRDYNNGRRGRDSDGYGDYGGSYELRQTALNTGFNEGVKAGRDDRRRNRSYEFRDESAFQKATKDYNSRLGDRELYRQYFREGFSHGYADGYQGY
jgi:hypothetical protein